MSETENRTPEILIVDDHPHVVRVLRLTLEQEGYRVTTASDGVEALRLFEASRPDAVISDIEMPNMSGRELCQSIRQRYPSLSPLILVMTSRTALEEREWVRALPNVDFYEKPVSPRNLSKRLSTYFHRSAQY